MKVPVVIRTFAYGDTLSEAQKEAQEMAALIKERYDVKTSADIVPPQNKYFNH